MIGKTETGGRLDVSSFVTPGLVIPSVSVSAGQKKKALTPVTVTWSDFSGANVDLYRDGVIIATPLNSGSYSYTQSLRGPATFVYSVCETGSDPVCAVANPITI